jgi:threonine/homoserine/homoserine lactone efflux protein
MDLPLFTKGIVIGFSVAAPVGPIGLLCIQRTLTKGRVSGLFTGLGAATADGVYGFIAAFGITFVTSSLVSHHLWFRVVGGVFLIVLGAKTFFSRPPAQSLSTAGKGLVGDYVSTLLLTLTNPMTVLSFAAICSALGLGRPGEDYGSAAVFILGTFSGSAIWWLMLSFGVGLITGTLKQERLSFINKICGIFLGGIGLVTLISSVQPSLW